MTLPLRLYVMFLKRKYRIADLATCRRLNTSYIDEWRRAMTASICHVPVMHTNISSCIAMTMMAFP
jgi:hypothetical protein